MKKKFFTPEVKEIMDFMFKVNGQTFVFIDDFQKKFERPAFLGKDDYRDQEACGFRANDGDQLVLQGTYLRLTKGIEAQLRVIAADKDGRNKVVKRVKFDELFGEREVVIGTTCESLHLMVPVCSSKLELAEFILGLREYKGGDYYTRDYYIAEAEKLAKFLYKHNPNKERDVLDELSDL